MRSHFTNQTFKMLNILLFGPPGSGKGTQAERLVKKYNLVHLSTGDMFRYELSNNTELGILARSYMDKGQLVPDSVTISMLEKRVLANKHAFGFIFDGFPRNIVQAEALDALLDKNKTSIKALIELVVDEDHITERILLRGKTSGRSDDNDETIIRKRFNVYKSETEQVADYYAQFGKTHKLNGVGEIDAIFHSICHLINGLK